jgi:hypothetical protein
VSRRISAEKSSSDDDEVVWGADAIGAEINRTAAQVYYLHGRGLLPTDKVGHRTMKSTRRRLRDWAAGKS